MTSATGVFRVWVLADGREVGSPRRQNSCQITARSRRAIPAKGNGPGLPLSSPWACAGSGAGPLPVSTPIWWTPLAEAARDWGGHVTRGPRSSRIPDSNAMDSTLTSFHLVGRTLLQRPAEAAWTPCSGGHQSAAERLHPLPRLDGICRLPYSNNFARIRCSSPVDGRLWRLTTSSTKTARNR